jgi:hypothetical protein
LKESEQREYEKELKKKVMEFLIDEWKHGVPKDKLKDPHHIKRVIDWVAKTENHQKNRVTGDYEWE